METKYNDGNEDSEKNFLENVGKSGELELSWRNSVKQIIAACIAHSLVIQAGINMAFSAVLLPQLKESGSTIKINIQQASWIASIVTAALPVGALTIGPLMDKFGRKKMCMLTTIPFIISWLLHNFATNVWYIYIARIISGFGAGLSTVGIVYVSEISHPKYRPMLLTLNSVFVTIGLLITCVLGFGLHWTTTVKVFLILIVLSLIGLCFIPESPYWLLVFRDDKKGCAKALQWLYTDKTVFEQQYYRILESTQTDSKEVPEKSTLLQMKENLLFYKKPIVWKPILILLILFILQQLTAAYVIVFYAVDIFRKIGGNFKHIGLINEFVALILLGGIRFAMSIVLAVISKKVERRYLMLVSAVGMFLTSLTVGLYMRFTQTHSEPINNIANQTVFEHPVYNSEHDGTVPIVLVLCYICFSSFGWMVIPWTLIGELLPVKVRGVLGGVTVSVAYIMMFLLVKGAPFLMDSVNLGTIFFGLSIVNACGIAFIYWFLPETLGRTFDDIAKYFVGVDNYEL